MPIFHDHYDSPLQRPPSQLPPSRELQTAGYAGKGLGSPHLDCMQPQTAFDAESRPSMEPEHLTHGRTPSMLNRAELIERIKRAKSPPWQHFQDNNGGRLTRSPEARPSSRDRPRTPLRSPGERKPSRTATPDPYHDLASAGFEIERPRSALHSGDFREKKEATRADNGSSSSAALATSPVAPWLHSFPAAAIPSSRGAHEAASHDPRPTVRSRAASQSSYSSPFVFMPPTSPLVQQSNNTDLDFSTRPSSRQSSKSPERSSRRHTFSPHSFQTFRATQLGTPAFGISAAPQLRGGGTFPYQAHQPRRSITSFNPFQPHSSPQTPVIQARRPSFSSDASPLHHAPMVGSYEESILRGRMSTTPSRPLDFVARIGVLGKGQCKANLRCPPHVTVPFPAVFYSYNGGNSRIADNSPSPYVGLIDLENSLPAPEEGSESRRKRRHTIPNPKHDDIDIAPTREDSPLLREKSRRREKNKRRSTSPKSPPGGSYRIPQQGQLQIIIKNPNKTAVKLFLVPYDLSDMEAGQKTFIRQRSYSAGPIIDMPLSDRKNLGTDRPEAALSTSDDPNDRPMLRYLIHLHICSPSKGRYYLYKSIRVVFANRVPDDKEKLRNETQLPDPPYSTYKPSRDSIASHSTSSAAAQLTAEKAFRRRSAGFPRSQQAHDYAGSYGPRPPPPPPAVQFTGGNTDRFSSPVSSLGPIPFSLSRLSTTNSRPASTEPMDMEPSNPFRSRTNSSSPRTDMGSPFHRAEAFEKLNRGDLGYGGNAFCGVGAPGAGLLARKLRGLDVQRNGDENEDK